MARTPAKKKTVTEAYRLWDSPDRIAAVLSNGMTLIAQRNDAAPLVAVRAYIQTGSAFEGRLEGSGLSHLLEHVVTGGATQRRDEAAIMAFGDAIGGLNNAYTAVDHMCYHVTAQCSRMAEALELIADWVVRPSLSRQVFDREMGVVRREWESDRDDPHTLLDELIYETAYRKHPLSHPVIGRADSLARLTYEDIVEYHRRTHVPTSCVLVVAGRQEPEAIVKASMLAFDGFEGPAAAAIKLPEPMPIHSPIRAIRRTRTDSTSMVLSWLTVREGAPDDVPLDMLVSLLTEGDSARLVRELRWEKGLVHDIAGTHESLWHSPGTLRFSAQLDAARVDAVEAYIVKSIEDLRQRPITEEEIERVRRQGIVAVEAGRLTAESHAAQIGMDFLATCSVDYSDIYLSAIRSTAREDLHRVAEQYLRPNARALVVVAPAKKSRSSARTGLSATPKETIQFVLDSGLRCIVRHVPGAAFVAVSASFHGGVRAEDESNSGLFNLLAEVMPRGTRSRSAERIAADFEGRGSYLRSGSGSDTIGLEYMALNDDFEPLMDVLSEVVISPALSQDQIEIIRPSILDAISRIDEDWHAELGRLARRCFFNKSPYRKVSIGTTESVSRLAASDLRATHAGFIHGGGVLSIAGGIDPEQVRHIVTRCLSGLPPPAKDVAATNKPDQFDHPAKEDRLFVKGVSDDRHTAAIFVGYPGCSVIDKIARAPLAICGTILAGYVLSGGRLFAALRGGEKNMVYEVAGAHYSGLLPGFFAFTAACEPDRVGEVHQIIRREVGELLAGRISDEELERARSMVLMAELEQLQTVADFARRDGFDELAGLGIGDGEAFLEEVRTATKEHIFDTARRFLMNATTVVVTPEPQDLQLGLTPQLIEF